MSELKRLEASFDLACVEAGYRDKWDAYRNEDGWPEALTRAHDEHIAALHADYDRRGITGMLEGL
ncbi:MAG: hypothetical protein NXH88_10050 [Hyphomonas sp.]|nr:hypothetical protein [Hyphomonas sp.]